MQKDKIEVIVSRELLNLVGPGLKVCVTVMGNDNIAKPCAKDDMVEFMRNIISEKEAAGQFRTAEAYRTALNCWHRFLGSGEPVSWERVTSRSMAAFADYLQERGATKNTQSFYFRILRAVCNRAQEQLVATLPENLFDNVYTGKARTRKRALPMDDIRRIATVEPKSRKEQLARDMFIFSFITRGMAPIDMAHLRKGNIVAGRLTYRRHKTGSVISMEWIAEMQEIVSRYEREGSDYLFPLISSEGAEGWKEFKRGSQAIGYHLRRLGKRLALPMPLTLYVARHSWATAAKSSGVSTALISDAMGHSSERMTQVYLGSIDVGRIDTANRKIVDILYNQPAGKRKSTGKVTANIKPSRLKYFSKKD